MVWNFWTELACSIGAGRNSQKPEAENKADGQFISVADYKNLPYIDYLHYKGIKAYEGDCKEKGRFLFWHK